MGQLAPDLQTERSSISYYIKVCYLTPTEHGDMERNQGPPPSGGGQLVRLLSDVHKLSGELSFRSNSNSLFGDQ